MPSRNDAPHGAPGDAAARGGGPYAIELRGVRQAYRDRTVLGPIDLAIEPGEFVTVVGPSGCGKSTLLRLIAGFTRPSAGSVAVSGRPVTGPGPDRGVVFQQPRLFPWLSVAANVGFGLRGLPRAARRARVAELLELTGLSDAARLRPYELSGGMRQRAAIARALATRPRVLLMDEPFAALDAFTRERMQDELRRLWRSSGTTVVFITHDVDEAVYLGTRAIALSGGPGRVIHDERSDLPSLPHPRGDARFGAARERLAAVIRSAAAPGRGPASAEERAAHLVGDPGLG
ncbi:ABC transporter ATP-binding protein [Thermobispora bispora]|uniref:ABC transporter ATP-binding protein n=1 Tax=Thermobispora bispora TaxID=2006 RepID=UPI00197F5503|nr:ABC transporter ATP-binding protein [Thermobispora bispora]QSI47906.1 ABC transporter ATP-binding protein [Thermobispora bispora]